MSDDECSDCGLPNGECVCLPDVAPDDLDDDYEWTDEPGDLAYEGSW